jgi:hypothetical protein
MEYLIAASITNRRALERSASIVHEKSLAMNDPESKRELLGHTIYIIRPQNLGFYRKDGAQPMATVQAKAEVEIPTFAFTFTDTYFICGFESSVDKAIRTLRSGESVAKMKWLNHAKTLLPSAAGIVNLEDVRATTEFLWWVLKTQKDKSADTAMAPSAMNFFISDLDYNFSLLPEYDSIKKYLGVSASYIISRDDGFFIEIKSLDQPEN